MTLLYKKYFFILALIFIIIRCSNKKITYNLPPDITEQQKKELMIVLGDGKKLYKENCDACHGIFSNAKDSMPNFSQKQFDNYKTGFILRDKKNHAVAKNLSPRELDAILTFLTYYKRK